MAENMQRRYSEEYNEIDADGRHLSCPMRTDFTLICNTLDGLASKIEHLIDLHRWVIKWLLIVVCVIALGRAALDLGENLIKKSNYLISDR